MKETNQIDIVLAWVDGSDPHWRARYDKYVQEVTDGDKREIRFRDWGLLRYWFRGIEVFAPWVRKIHFVTSGEFPKWLDASHPKLNWVKHSDFIPHEYLPTFNINAIETNLHRIEGLSDNFIYFNDDMFLTQECKPTNFFKNNLPCDFAVLDPIIPYHYPEIVVNNIMAINRHFAKKEAVNKNLSKWINLKYGRYLTRTLLLLPWKKFPGFLEAHLAHPYRKETFREVWQAEPDLLHQTGIARFRSHTNANQWLFRYWHLAKGEFMPTDVLSQGQTFEVSDSSIDHICDLIRRQQYMQVCINDGENISDFEKLKEKLAGAFDQILPTQSSFERV